MRVKRRATPHTTDPATRLVTRLPPRAFRTGGWLVMVAVGCSAIACVHPKPPLVVTDADPAVKIPAIQKAVREKDLRVARQLIKDLENDDPAVRFYAVEGLHRLTKQNFGYRYYDDDDRRAPALKKWQQWLQDQERAHQAAHPATTQP